MTKLFKTVTVVAATLIAALCLCLFAAACDKEEYATDSFTVTVKDENGNLVDGTATNAEIQCCAVGADGTLGVCYGGKQFFIDENGVATVDLIAIKDFVASFGESTQFELHVLNVDGYAEGDENSEYGRYDVNKVPKSIEIKLVKLS